MAIFNSRLTEPQRLLEQGRNQMVDLIRGVDIVLMVLFNYSVTLSYFRLINMPSNFLYWFVFPISIAMIFIFISGVVAHISFEKNKENFREKYFTRGGKLLIFAAFITLFTYIFVPEGTIFFGILHFFAVSSFLVPFLIRYDKPNLICGLLIILSGAFLQLTQFDFSYLFWLGFMARTFFTFDYFPLIPWLGVLMLGIYFGKYIIRRMAALKFESRLAKAFMFLGKNSLTVYLIHQPVLIFLLIVSGFKIF
jgi:uncharacterized membrane protein